MAEDINLLPTQGQENKAQVQQKKLLKNVSVAVLALCILAVVIVLGGKVAVDAQIKNADQMIAEHTQHIQSMKDQEGVYRSLSSKLTALSTYFSTQKHYSTVLQELNKTLPNSLKLTDMTVLESQETTLTGTIGSYADLAGFYNKLRQAGAKGDAGSSVGTYFQQPTLTTISRNDSTGSINFSIKFTLSNQLLSMQPGGNQ